MSNAHRIAAFGLLLVVGAAGPARAQVEVDRVLQRVGDQVITELDVRRARMLKLVTPEATTDDAIQRELENHWLMVAEIVRFNPAPPEASAVLAERERWRTALGAGTDVQDLMARAGMTNIELETWFRDNLRIRAYLDSRFGAVSPADRQTVIDEWIRGLRARAGLR